MNQLIALFINTFTGPGFKIFSAIVILVILVVVLYTLYEQSLRIRIYKQEIIMNDIQLAST